MSNCPNCGNPIGPGAAFCDNCGASIGAAAAPRAAAAPAMPIMPAAAPAGGSACPQCGAAVIPGTAFCDNCGAAIPSGAPIAPQPLSMPQPVAPPVVPVAQPPMAPPAPLAAAGMVTCSACGASVPAGQAFCDNCGASLAGRPAAIPAAAPAPLPYPPQPVPPMPAAVAPMAVMRPRLVTADGTQIDLTNKPQAILGREDPVSGVFPEVDLTPHGGEAGGVSRRHARLTNQGTQWTIEDLNSTNLTFVNNQKLAPGAPQVLKNGDQIRLGRVVLTFQVY